MDNLCHSERAAAEAGARSAAEAGARSAAEEGAPKALLQSIAMRPTPIHLQLRRVHPRHCAMRPTPIHLQSAASYQSWGPWLHPCLGPVSQSSGLRASHNIQGSLPWSPVTNPSSTSISFSFWRRCLGREVLARLEQLAAPMRIYKQCLVGSG